MIAERRERFELFGRLDTWIVGIQYYDGALGLETSDVFFARDPDNPFDPNAVAVLTRHGQQIGHIPRYDAEFFSPLIADGVIALKGQVGESNRGDRLPLALEVYATSKVSEILVPDNRNDWRAIYHNLFIGIWERLSDYSSATLKAFRDRFRPLAHEQALYPKTQFLYRMLKAHIADLEKQEEIRLREQVIAAVTAMRFGHVTGWPEMTVIPIDADGPPAATPAEDATTNTALAARDTHLPDVLRLLPSRCPYPPGARGAVVLVQGEWFSLAWFDAAECAQVYWYQMILAGLDQAMREKNGNPEGRGRTAEEVKAHILDTLAQAVCSMSGTEEEEGGARIDIQAGVLAGHALHRGGALVRLRMHEAEPEVIYDKPRPTCQSQRLHAD